MLIPKSFCISVFFMVYFSKVFFVKVATGLKHRPVATHVPLFQRIVMVIHSEGFFIVHFSKIVKVSTRHTSSSHSTNC